MDRALIERMIGAAVLVLIFVLFAPAILDGQRSGDAAVDSAAVPVEDGFRTEVIVLNAPLDGKAPIETDKQAAAEPLAMPAKPDGSEQAPPVTEPSPMVNQIPAKQVAEVPAAETARLATNATGAEKLAAGATPVAAQTEATAKTSAGTPATRQRQPAGFGVQLGSFSSRENADKYATSVRKDGFTTFIAQASGPSGTVYRVYAGPRETRSDAQKLASVLAASGRGVLVVDLSAQE